MEYGIVVSEPLLNWRPIESMLMWASGALVDHSQPPRYAPPEEEYWDSESRRAHAALILDGELKRYERVTGPVPDRQILFAALPVYQSIVTQPILATRNSPLKLASPASLVNAAVPGVTFLASDGDVTAAVIATATSLFVTYVAVPSLRGIGSALEQVLHEWVLTLRPVGRTAQRQSDSVSRDDAAVDQAAERGNATPTIGGDGE